jgi:membrane fusion protein, multidrug efflux system
MHSVLLGCINPPLRLIDRGWGRAVHGGEFGKRQSMKRILIALAFLAVLGGAGFAYRNYHLAAVAPTPEAPPTPQPVPVVAAAVVRKPMPVMVNAIGTVQPIATVVVKSRIDGQIAKVNVRDGQEVKAGEILFVLDSRSAEAQVRQAEAQLVKDRAQLANARRESGRQGELAAKNYASQSIADTAQTNAAALDAAVRADEAVLDNLKTLLSYYTITSSIDGRIGAIALKEGNAVKAVDTIALLTVNQMRPIYVAFSVPQNNLPAIREEKAKRDLPVTAQAPGQATSETGKLAFIDNAVDATTGTVMLRGVFDNPKETLWPGQFVNASLTLRVEAAALVIPAQAVQVGQESSYVYVIKPDNTVEPRTVKISRSAAGESVVASGLSEGDKVVVDGQLRLTKGTLVEPREATKQSGGTTS